MGGPNLEVFKFGLYLFVPIWALFHFGDPQWFHDNVTPYKKYLFPSDDRTNQMIPTDQSGIKEEIARFRAEKAARRFERQGKPQPEEERRV